jgi:hypothetical protein
MLRRRRILGENVRTRGGARRSGLGMKDLAEAWKELGEKPGPDGKEEKG